MLNKNEAKIEEEEVCQHGMNLKPRSRIDAIDDRKVWLQSMCPI